MRCGKVEEPRQCLSSVLSGQIHESSTHREDSDDGDVLRFGPGQKTLDVVFFPSANVNPGVHLLHNPRYPQIARDFARSFATWKALSCDVFLADHGEFYGMKAKYARLRDGAATNPFIDPDGYRNYIEAAQQRFEAKLAEER